MREQWLRKVWMGRTIWIERFIEILPHECNFFSAILFCFEFIFQHFEITALLITHPWYAECANANEKKRQKRKTTRVNFAEGILWNRVKNERRRETQSIQLWRWCGKWIYIIITEVINSSAPQKNVRNLKWTHSVQGRG